MLLSDPKPSPPRAAGTAPARAPLWLSPNLLALDAPVVAVAWLGASAAAFSMPVALPTYLTLFLCVWCLYACDRLVDAARLRSGDLAPDLQTARHAFALRHAGAFAGVALAAAFSAGLMAFSLLERPVFGAGLIVLVGAAAYFGAFVAPARGQRPLPGKPLAAGALFAAGSTVPVFADYSGDLPVIPALALLAALFALNCLMISDKDSAPPGKGNRRGQLVLALAVALSLAAAVLAWHSSAPPPAASPLRPFFFALSLSAAGLAILQGLRRHASREPFRVLADAALLTPLIPAGALAG